MQMESHAPVLPDSLATTAKPSTTALCMSTRSTTRTTRPSILAATAYVPAMAPPQSASAMLGTRARRALLTSMNASPLLVKTMASAPTLLDAISANVCLDSTAQTAKTTSMTAPAPRV